MATQMMTLGLWWFLPGTITGYAQDFYYRLTIRAGDPWPEKGSPRWRKHYRAIFTLVILTYLCYTIYESDWQQQRQSDLYKILGLPHNVSTKDVKSQMRRLAAKYHPDKIGSGPESEGAGQVYAMMGKAAEILGDPVKRFAYDRLGPAVIEYEKAGIQTTYLEYTKRAMLQTGQTYLGSFVVLIVLGYTNYMRQGRYWRWLLFFALAWFEVTTYTRPKFPALLTTIVNPIIKAVSFGSHAPLLPFQFLIILRTLSISVNIAFNQLGPFYQTPGNTHDASEAEIQRMFQEQMVGLKYLVDQSRNLLSLELRPFLESNEGGEAKARDAIKRWLVVNEVMKDENYRRTLESAAIRKREGRRLEDELADEIVVG